MINIDYLIIDKDISNLSNYNTKAFTKYYFEINNRQDIDKLVEIKDFANQNKLEILFIWWWTNLLFAFDVFEGIVIKNCLKWWNYNEEFHILETYSSEKISDIAIDLFKRGQLLWKRFIWLPWSVWGAVYWNAWCFWLETENNFLSAELLNLNTWKLEIFDKKQMNFDYRTSIVKKLENYFIISTKFDLSILIEKYSSDVDNIHFREHRQPKWNTCGSFFKNPSREISAWKLIEDIWYKWKKLWWAFFSEIHANFLMNDWTATYRDLLDIVEIVTKIIKDKYNIDMVPEVRIITNKN